MSYVHGGDIYTYEGMLDFSVNINPFGPSQAVIDAACEAIKSIGAYPDSQCRELRHAMEEELQIPEDNLIFGNGAADLIFSLVLAEKPKKAILTAPTFAEYAQALEAVGCEVCFYYLEEKKNFRLDETYLEMLTEDVDMIFLCSPDNPTGNVIEPSLLERIARKCEKSGVRMVVDECFYEFTENGESVLSQFSVSTYPQLFLLRAFTKMHAVPGLRLGYGITADQALLERIERVRQPWSVSAPAQAAGMAALSERDRVQKTRAFVTGERKRLEQELERIGIQYIPSAANYILFKSSYDLFELLKERRILIRDCSNYEGLDKGFYRMAVKTREENNLLMQALKEIYAG
ncbi:MAG: threonine-phosphate decarboxylase CobD [Muricomes sp.]